ncbi:hypothetical protein Tco_1143539 [Tanacetum coccineum]
MQPCPLPDGKNCYWTKWILKNKRDAIGIVVRNKAGWWLKVIGKRRALIMMRRRYVLKPKGFEDPHLPKHVYRVVKALYGLHQAPRACQDICPGDAKKFDMESVRPATTPFEASKPKSKDEPDDAINVHLYRSMIGSLMYLTASRPNIQFAVYSTHEISPFVGKAYSDSDYAGSHGDRKSTTGGCQFLGRRLISWQCKKQTIMATSSTEAEYVAAANCLASMCPYTDDNVLLLDWLSVFSGVARVPTGSFTCSYW